MKKVNEDGVKFVWREAQWLRHSSEAPGILLYKNSLTEDEPFKSVNFKRRGRQPSTYLFMSRHHPTIEEEDQEPFESSGSEYVPSKLEKSNSDEQVAQAARLPTANGRTRKRRSKGEGDLLQWKRSKNACARLHGYGNAGFTKDSSARYQQNVNRQPRQVMPQCQRHTAVKRGTKQKLYCITKE